MEENEQEVPVEEVQPEVEEIKEEVSAEDLGLPEDSSADGDDDAKLRAMLEAIIYVTDEPLPAKLMAQALQKPVELIEARLAELVEDYNKPGRGLSIRELAGGYQMSTKAEYHDEIRNFVKKLNPPLKLSLAALETLAVIAYKQPITSPEVLEIRGVQGGGVIKTLLDRKLITASGRKQVLGRPVLYKTTKEFLLQFGLKDLTELPTLKEFEEISRLALGDGDLEPEPEAAPVEAPPTEEKTPDVNG